MDNIELGTILKSKYTSQLVSVCMISDGVIYWDDESKNIGLDTGNFKVEQINDWEIISDYLRTPSGSLYEADEGIVVLHKYELNYECNKCIVSAYLEQIFMQDGWKDIFDVEDDLVYGLSVGSFGLLDFIEAVNHFLQDGCPLALLALAEKEED